MIYNRVTSKQVKQLDIDNLELRHKVHKAKVYYDIVHTKASRIRLCDNYDKAKVLATHNLKQLAQKQVEIGYVIVNNSIVKLNDYTKQLRHNKQKYIINGNYLILEDMSTIDIYITTKSNMERKLKELTR